MLAKIKLFCSTLLVATTVLFFSTTSFSQEKAGDIIENVNAKSDVDEVNITWNVKYDKLPLEQSFVIRYIQSNLTKLDKESAPWKYTDILPATTTNHEIKNISSNDKYSYQIGIVPLGTKASSLDKSKVNWYKSKSFSTDRGWSWNTGLAMRILMLLGALGLFIYGMKTMSEGIQKAAGTKLRQILGSMTSNRVKGIFTGFLTTSIIQSSSATTVMVVSFVNAGLLSLKQSIGVVMGANIGTTVTAWLVAYVGFKISMSDYSLPIFLIAIILLFANKSQLKSWGEMLAGFALLFIGLEMLKSGVPDVKGNIDSLQFIKEWSGTGIGNVLLAVLIGTIVTIVVQSSSAAMAVTILLCARDVIPFEMAAGMVLGENIGTTITANLAAIVGNVHAKRAARAHLVFNLFGVIWMVLVFGVFINWVDYIVTNNMGYGSPLADSSDSQPIALAVFHTLFNILNVLLMVWFVTPISKLVIKMVPSKGGEDEEFHLDYIGHGIMNTPELSLVEVHKELAKFGKITSKMSGFNQRLLVEKNKKEKANLYARIKKYEEITDRLEIEIANYLNKVAEDGLTEETSKRVRGMNSIANDLERVGDIFYQISKTIERKEAEKIWFSPSQRESLKEMFTLVDEAFVIMTDNLNNSTTNTVTLATAQDQEHKINIKRDEMRQDYLKSMEATDFNIRSGMVYNDLFSSCEKIGDHLINVSEAIVGEI